MGVDDVFGDRQVFEFGAAVRAAHCPLSFGQLRVGAGVGINGAVFATAVFSLSISRLR